MFRWPAPLAFQDAEKTRQANLVYRLVLVMGGLSVLAALGSLLEPQNEVNTTITFYSSVVVWFMLIALLTRAGFVKTATFFLITCYWVLIAGVSLVFGGLQGQNASNFAVCTLLAGSLLGFRIAMAMATLSSAWCALVAYLEVHDQLPEQLVTYSPWNAWGSVTVTVFLTTALLQVSMQRLRRMHEAATRSAEERDEAFRRSINGQKMELVGSLTSGVAHDLNNLLTVIVSVSSSLRAKTNKEDIETTGLLEELETATSRAALMTTQLLTFGRSPTQQIEGIDLSQSVLKTGRLLSRVLGTTTECSLEVEPQVTALASRTGIEQILLNLAVNARDAMPDGGKLVLRVRKVDETALLEVEDSGQGMTDAVKARIFEPFFTTKAAGTGLGLATVRQLMEHFGGRIEIETAPGSGTRFRLYFQLTKPTPSLRPSPEPPPGGARAGELRGKVLLVEDDRFVQRAMARMLEGQGFSVITAADGDEGLRLVRSTPDLSCVVSDIVMPKMDGEQMALELKKTHPHLPILLVSGNRQASASVLDGLPRAFLQKPVDEAKLRRTLRELLGGPPSSRHMRSVDLRSME